MNREAVIVPEKKEKIERIKRKYNDLSMSDDIALKINTLEVTNNILKAVTGVVGIVAAVDWIIVDPVPAVDEAVLTGATALLGLASNIVSNKIQDLATKGSADIQMEEVNKLSSQLNDVAHKAKDTIKARKASNNPVK